MSTYKKPVVVRADDPLCSVSALDGVVVGILFEKTGKEIKEAISKRLVSIDGRISECEGTIGSVQEFIKVKEVQVDELEQFCRDRDEEKKAKLRPMEREIEQVCDRMRATSFDHVKETEKQLAKKAATFDDRFNEFKDSFRKIDDFLKEVHVAETVALMSVRGMSGSQGPSGNQGCQGNNGNVGFSAYHTSTTDDKIEEVEDMALARLERLKSVVYTYSSRVTKIQVIIEQLREERRRLVLIERNVAPDRAYKLDLNKLSAFGFEDVEIV
jgi:DNA-binding Lrp family transcriptional regulator